MICAKDGWICRFAQNAVIESPRKSQLSLVVVVASCRSISLICSWLAFCVNTPSVAELGMAVIVILTQPPDAGNANTCSRSEYRFPVTVATVVQVPLLPSVEFVDVAMV